MKGLCAVTLIIYMTKMFAPERKQKQKTVGTYGINEHYKVLTHRHCIITVKNSEYSSILYNCSSNSNNSDFNKTRFYLFDVLPFRSHNFTLWENQE